MEVSMTVNGTTYTNDVEPRTLLVHHLRENLRLTGTNVGCDTSQCGACTIHVNGEAVKSCTMLAVQADGSEITTVEGLAKDSELHPVQSLLGEPRPTMWILYPWNDNGCSRNVEKQPQS